MEASFYLQGQSEMSKTCLHSNIFGRCSLFLHLCSSLDFLHVSASPIPIPLLHLCLQVITYFAGRVFNPNKAELGRISFAGEYLKGDASLRISDLSLMDSGEYSCKVKTGALYHWSTVHLIVLGKSGSLWFSGFTPKLAYLNVILTVLHTPNQPYKICSHLQW